MKVSQKNANYSICDKSGNFLLKDVFRLLSNVNRFRIFSTLVNHSEIIAPDIYKLLNVSRSACHGHLQLLELHQILSKRKRGSQIYYSLNQNNRSVKVVRSVLASYCK